MRFWTAARKIYRRCADDSDYIMKVEIYGEFNVNLDSTTFNRIACSVWQSRKCHYSEICETSSPVMGNLYKFRILSDREF